MKKSERATKLVRILQEHGFEAYWVGGCVRDLLLGKEPKDFDVATNATPDQIGKIFPNHHAVGKQFGVLLIDFPEGNIEAATFRTESGYSDKRRPDTVEWSTAEQDVLRRDFTINGLLYDPVADRVIDHVGGQQDIGQKIVRFIGDPKARIHEDPVRLLRAIRFKTTLQFEYAPETVHAMQEHVTEIKHVAGERIGQELARILGDKARLDGFLDLDATGLLKLLIPELDRLKGTPQPIEFHKEGDVFDHVVKALGTLPADAPSFLAWAVILHDSGKPDTLALPAHSTGRITTYGHAELSAKIAREVLGRFRYPRVEIETVAWMIAHHMSLKQIDEMRPARREAYVLDPRFPWLLELHKADASGAIPVDLSLYHETTKLYEKMVAEHKAMATERPALLVSGHDLILELGIEEGPAIGVVLEEIRDAQLAGSLKTRSDALLFAAKRYGKAVAR